MKKLTPEDLEKIRVKNIANILRKQAAGSTLSAREEAALAAYAAGGELPERGAYAKTQEELAAACNVDRKTIGNIIRDHPERLPGKKRGAESDGRYHIPSWQRLLEELDVRGRGANNAGGTLQDERALKLRKLKVDVERAEWNFEKEKDRHLPVAQFEGALAVMLTAFAAALDAFAGRVNPKLEGLDYDGRAKVIEDELDIVRRTLAECEYLKSAAQDDDAGGAEDLLHEYR